MGMGKGREWIVKGKNLVALVAENWCEIRFVHTIVDALLDFPDDDIDVHVLFVEAINLVLDILLEDLVLEFGLGTVLPSNHTGSAILIYNTRGKLIKSSQTYPKQTEFLILPFAVKLIKSLIKLQFERKPNFISY